MSLKLYPEKMTRKELELEQWKLVQRLLVEVVPRNQFWSSKYEQAGVRADSVKSWAEFQRLPFCTKQELVEDQLKFPPYGSNLSEELGSFTRCHQTSGTTGKPMSWLDTPGSWEWFLECWEQNFRLAGIGERERFLFPFSFGPFVGFWAGFEGAQRAGHFVFAAGGMSTEARLELIERHQLTVLCCTPTYALRMLEVAEKECKQIAAGSVKFVMVAGEPGGAIPSIRNKIERGFGARVIDHWGMTDIGPLGIESYENPGDLMLLETACFPEIIDPETLRPVAVGEQGELVITNLGRWGMPVIRYRTGDLVRQATTPNRCGRSLLRLQGGVVGRVDDMITIRGNNVFPSAVDAVLREIEEIAEHQVTVTATGALQQVKLEIEPVSIDVDREVLRQRVQRMIKDRLQFQAEVLVVDVGALPRYELKSRRFRKIF
jgi:phenylacetate-CoA ligase